MSDESRKEGSPAIAAAIIVIVVGALVYVLPKLVLWIANFSTVLAVIFGSAVMLSFFLIFWLRARYQRKRDRQG